MIWTCLVVEVLPYYAFQTKTMPFILCLDTRDIDFRLSTSRDCLIEDFAIHSWSILSTLCYSVNMERLSSSMRFRLPVQWDLMRTWTAFFSIHTAGLWLHTHTKSSGIFKLPVFFVEAMDPYYIYLLGGFTYVPYKYIYIDTHIVVSCGWLDYSPTHQMFPISFHPQKVSLLFHHKIDWS